MWVPFKAFLRRRRYDFGRELDSVLSVETAREPRTRDGLEAAGWTRRYALEPA